MRVDRTGGEIYGQRGVQTVGSLRHSERLERQTIIGVCALASTPIADSFTGQDGRIGQVLLLLIGAISLRQLLRWYLGKSKGVLSLLVLLCAVSVSVLPLYTKGSDLPVLEFFARIVGFGSLYVVLGAGLASSCFRASILRGLLLSSCIVAITKVTGLSDAAGHIEAGRAIGVGLPLAPILLLSSKRRQRVNLALFGSVIVLLSLGALLSGARAPLVVGVALLSGEVLVLSVRSLATGSRGSRGLSVLAVGLFCSGFLIFNGEWIGSDGEKALLRQSEVTSARSFQDLASGQDRISNAYKPALNLIREKFPFGEGLPADVLPGGRYTYAHNVFLELSLGLGVAGVLIGASLVAATIVCVRRYARVSVEIVGLVVFYFLNAQVSGDLATNRQLFLIGGLAAWSVVRGGIDVRTVERTSSKNVDAS